MKWEDVGGIGLPIRPRFTVEQAEMIRDLLQPGDKVKAEICYPRLTNGGSDAKTEVETVTILKKHEFIAETSKGDVSWTNILIHNEGILRREK